LNLVEERRKASASAVFTFLKSVANVNFPNPGDTFVVKTFSTNGSARDQVEYKLMRPEDTIATEHVKHKR